jgi:hypothetical protein
MAKLDSWTRTWPTVLTGIGVAVILVAGLTAAVVVEGPDGPRYPDAWDPRVADLAGFVARERRLSFDHPVFVHFLDDEAFRRSVVAGEDDLTIEDRVDLDQGAQLLRATGLVPGSYDPLESSNQLTGEGTLAYYDSMSERITVRGTQLTPGVRATLVHELTHALQDQYFDLSRLGALPNDSANNAFRAVIEGDALRVERGWSEQLAPAERDALDAERLAEVEGAETPGVPGALSAFFSAPYDLGAPFIDVVHAERDQAGLDEALRLPPTTEEQLLDPFAYLEGDGPLAVEVPTPAADEIVREEGDFGALTWYLVLAEHLEPRRALAAVDGWGGDAYVAFERAGRACVRSAFQGDTVADTDEMEVALVAWAAAVPATDASVTRAADAVVLDSCDPGADSCDPGADAGAPGGGAENAVAYPVTRTYITLGALAGGLPLGTARCVGNAFVQALPAEELADLDSLLADPDALADQSQRATQACA